MRNKKRPDPFTIVILLVSGLFTCAITLTIFYFFPVSILTCRYVEADQADCQLEERMLGVIPLRQISITHLKEAYVVSEVHTTRRDGREVDLSIERLMLKSDSDTVALNSFDEFGGIFIKQSVKKIKNFLYTHTDEPLRIWQATWMPLLICGFFFLVSLVLLYAGVEELIRLIAGKLR